MMAHSYRFFLTYPMPPRSQNAMMISGVLKTIETYLPSTYRIERIHFAAMCEVKNRAIYAIHSQV